jgi:hypothetical protein
MQIESAQQYMLYCGKKNDPLMAMSKRNVTASFALALYSSGSILDV